jgi:hypothetical protein
MQNVSSAHTDNEFDRPCRNAGAGACGRAGLQVQYILEKVCHGRLDRHERALVDSALADLGMLDEADRSLALGVFAEFQARAR